MGLRMHRINMFWNIFPKFSDFNHITRTVWTVSISGSDICLKNLDSTINKEPITFPSVWLRDNCQCPECFHRPSESRTIHINKFNFSALPDKTRITENEVEITWDDNHISNYKISWLIERQFTVKHQDHWKKRNYKDKKVIWNAEEFPKILKRFSFNKLLESDTSLLSWLECLSIWGIAIVEDAGSAEGKVRQLADRIAFLKKTQYGDVFRVEAKDGTTNVAYLSAPLQLHTDLPYYHYKPGVNLLHCILQGKEGGENQLVDGFAVASELKTKDQSLYNILKNTDIVWSDKCYEDGQHYHSIHMAPVIGENCQGEVERINFSQPQRDSHFIVPLPKVNIWYKALKEFSEIMYSTKYSVVFRMNPGDIVTFDNLRLVHGRADYRGHRFVEGAYVDWDHIFSRIRILRSAQQ